ncbi:MAG: hypothetical protein U0841_10880 [Chloroflexia bacterium]
MEIIAAPPGLPVGLVEGFRENNVGDLEKEVPTDELGAARPDHRRLVSRGGTTRPFRAARISTR